MEGKSEGKRIALIGYLQNRGHGEPSRRGLAAVVALLLLFTIVVASPQSSADAP